jgi:hypothetical protein
MARIRIVELDVKFVGKNVGIGRPAKASILSKKNFFIRIVPSLGSSGNVAAISSPAGAKGFELGWASRPSKSTVPSVAAFLV